LVGCGEAGSAESSPEFGWDGCGDGAGQDTVGEDVGDDAVEAQGDLLAGLLADRNDRPGGFEFPTPTP
jgi:hypothetical protein